MKILRYILSPRFFVQLLFTLFFISESYSQVTQEWVSVYNPTGNGHHRAEGIVVDAQGNVYVACRTTLGGIPKDVIVKYNSLGTQQWVVPFTSSDWRAIAAIEIDLAGNIYVTGGTGPNINETDLTTIKYDSAGTPVWSNVYNRAADAADVGYAIVLDAAGNTYVTGQSIDRNTLPQPNYNYMTIKYNSSGVRQWVQQYDGPGSGYDSAIDIVIDSQGNVYVAGTSYGGTSIGDDYATIKYNSNGVQQWVRRYNGPNSTHDRLIAMVLDISGNIYVTGNSSGGSSTQDDYLTIKYNPSGDSLWVRRYHLNFDKATGMAIDNAGSIYVTGHSYGGTSTGWDYLTIKYNSAGEQQWFKRYDGGANDMAWAITTDIDANIYVTGISNTDFATIKYNSAGDSLWMQTYSRTSQSIDRSTEITLDAQRNVYVSGHSDYLTNSRDMVTIKYSQGLSITNPSAGEKWIAGETDTIKWSGGQAGQSLNIELSTDGGNNYFLIDSAIPADSNKYIWSIPDSLLSRRALIKLKDRHTSTEVAVSDTFKLKGYVLTRITPDGNYEAFESNKHGWNYLNTTLWPASWWAQFLYAIATDPYTNELYPAFFFFVADSSFVDWPLWVEVFSTSRCYWSTSIPIYDGSAQEKWKAMTKPHNGSCFGFAASSFLAFNYRDQFFPRHPGVPNVSNIFNLNLTNTIQKTINGYYAYQHGKQSLDNDVIGKPKDPRTTLQEVMAMFLSDTVDVRTITMFRPGGGGAHTMAPIKVVRDNTGNSRYRILLYDSNNPGVSTPYILIDSLNNTWTDSTGLGYGAGTNRCYLEIPVSNYLNIPVLSKMKTDNSNGTNNIEFYNTEKADIIYNSLTGERIGVIDGIVIDEISDGIAIFNKNGSPSDPIGYYIPDDTYSVVMNNISDSSGRAFISVFKEDVIYSYERYDAESNQTDRFKFDDGFSVASPDLDEKQINLTVIARLDSSERIMFIQETQLRQNDSLFLKELNQTDFIIKNYGTAKNYKLEINERSETELGIFQNASVELSNNSSHIIVPNWSDLTNGQLTIYIDEGNDGTIDDTLHLNNTVDVKDEGNLLTPNEYNLAQNYPNPFNPLTTIQYSIPQRSNVSIIVYDVLGSEVAELVNEEKDRGVYSINFDASGLASGLYLYRIQAGNFVETKKMIVLK